MMLESQLPFSKGNLIYVTHITQLEAVILVKMLFYVALESSMQTIN